MADQIDLLRATVHGDFGRAEEISHALGGSGGLDGYGEIIGAAFLLAVRVQFPGQWSMADVVRLVADARITVDPTGAAIDATSAERIVCAALGQEEQAEGLSDTTVVQAQIAIVSALAHQRKLGDPEVFLRQVEDLLAEWEADDRDASPA